MPSLLIIDIQRDYFPGGAYPLAGPEQAADNAAGVLERFRDDRLPIVHLQHVWDEPEATFMRPGTEGVEIHPVVAPTAADPVITKSAPNGFLDTELERTRRESGDEELVVCGMMSSMCVDATVRAAADLGFEVSVVHDACAAPQLEFAGTTVPAPAVHGAFMAALGDGYATVLAADELLETGD